MKYTLGFLFAGDQVLLQRKYNPIWQRGKLNGIGGGLEDFETILECMNRESLEEIGQTFDWQFKFEMVVDSTHQVFIFKAATELRKLLEAEYFSRSTLEPCELINYKNTLIDQYRTIKNLSWIIPLVADDSCMTSALINTRREEA